MIFLNEYINSDYILYVDNKIREAYEKDKKEILKRYIHGLNISFQDSKKGRSVWTRGTNSQKMTPQI